MAAPSSAPTSASPPLTSRGDPRAARPARVPTVSAIVCSYADERWPCLVDAVRSLRRQTLPALELIVVVDHNPALFARAREELPCCVVVANPSMRGLSAARNAGVAVARGEVVAFLDDDAVAADDWIERLVDAYDGPCVLGVGGSIEPHWVDGRPAGFPAEFLWVVGCTYAGMPTRRAQVRNPIGANMSLRRAVVVGAGGFRDGIGRVGRVPVGCEETELCIRAARGGGVFLYEPAARVSHLVPAERASWRYFRSRCYAEGLSKARVAAATGARAALSSERSYTLRALPRGFARGVADAARGDRSGLVRAMAIAAGLAVTSGGYLVGKAGA